MYAGVVILAHIQHSQIFADGKSLVVVHALTSGGKQSEMQMAYTGLRQQRATLRVGMDKILAARQLARLVVGSAWLDSARFNFFTS